MLNIAIVAGGDSGEYEISVLSGKQIEEQMDKLRFDPYLIEIRGGQWICHKGSNDYLVDKNDFTLFLDGNKIRFHGVFNAIHGTPGEDGKLQGYLDMIKIPYTSSNVATSAVTFHKAFCKEIIGNCGVNMAKSVYLSGKRSDQEQRIVETLRFPVFVKPNSSGSSVGMTKVIFVSELEAALENAFREDNEVLVEEFLPGRELTCGVLRTEGNVVALPVTEIIPKKDFFDYEAKYTRGMAEEVVPAQVSPEVSDACQRLSERLYEKLNCRGIVRFDYIYHNNMLYFLEVNSVPGMTAASIVPKMVHAHGWTFTEFITRLIDEAITRNLTT